MPARRRTLKGEKQKYRDEPGDEDQKREAQRQRRASANRTCSILKAALNHAFSEDEHAAYSDIAWRRLKPFTKVDATRQGHLTVAEARRSHQRSRSCLRLPRSCAGRAIYRLSLRRIMRPASARLLPGKIAIHRSKSGKPRDVVLNGEAIAFFEQLTAGRPADQIMLRNLGRLARAHGKQDVDGKDDGAWRKSEQLRLMADVCERAKITPPIGFHQLRHTWASLAVMNDMPLMVVARNLGHRDTRMVEKHYGHLAPSFIDKAIREVRRSLGLNPIGRLPSSEARHEAAFVGQSA